MADHEPHPATPTLDPDAPITVTVVRNIEPLDVREFLARYARAIVEARGTGARPALTLVSSEAA